MKKNLTALEVIQLARQYNCSLALIPPDMIKYSSRQQLSEHLLNEIKLHKPELLEYLKYTSRDLSVLLKRAFDGFKWLLERKRKYYCYNSISMSNAQISVNEWRVTVKTVLKMNDAELEIIERLLIQGKQFKYTDESKILLVASEQEPYLLDDDMGTAFNNWLNTPREFVFC